MSNITWLFIIVCIAIGFPILMVQVNNYFDNTPDDFDEDVDLGASNWWLSTIFDYLGVSDFIDAMGNIPQPLRGFLYSVWIIMLVYVIVKALPLT